LFRDVFWGQSLFHLTQTSGIFSFAKGLDHVRQDRIRPGTHTDGFRHEPDLIYPDHDIIAFNL
jgi:hypothetical protein